MSTWSRRIRAAVGIGIAWGAAWFGAGIGLLLIVGPDAADVPFPLAFGAFGFLAGATFSAIFGYAVRGRRLEQISLGRFAAWGGAAGLALAGMFALISALLGEMIPLQHLPILGPVFGLAGAISASGSLALARRGQDRPLPSGENEADGKELSSGR